MSSSFLDRCLATIQQLLKEPPGKGFVLTAEEIETHGYTPDRLVRAIFDEVEAPLKISTLKGNMTIEIDHEVFAAKEARQ